MTVITEKMKLKALIQSKTDNNVQEYMSNVITCQSFSKGFVIISSLPNINNVERFTVYFVDYSGEPQALISDDSKLPFVGSFDECNALMTVVTA